MKVLGKTWSIHFCTAPTSSANLTLLSNLHTLYSSSHYHPEVVGNFTPLPTGNAKIVKIPKKESLTIQVEKEILFCNLIDLGSYSLSVGCKYEMQFRF